MGTTLNIAGVGDNTTDIYTKQGRCFPGGNALNVAVFARRLGAGATYIGVLGDDARGDAIANALAAEEVNTERVRRVARENAFTLVDHRDGDRFFIGSDPTTAQMLCLAKEDFEFLSGFDHIHTSIYSLQEDVLQDLRAAAGTLSYDFSNKFDARWLDLVMPQVDCGFLSFGGRSRDEIDAFLRRSAERYKAEVIVTAGAAGSFSWYEGALIHAPAHDVTPVDTLGAGDAFIAQYLVARLDGAPIRRCLELAGEIAAQSCLVEGSFGYGITLDAQEVSRLVNSISTS